MSMFSRSSFKPPTPPLTSQPEDHTSPFHEEEEEDEYEFNLNDPRFIPSARSRAGSDVDLDRTYPEEESQDRDKERDLDLEREKEIVGGLLEKLRARDKIEGVDVSDSLCDIPCAVLWDTILLDIVRNLRWS
jgi:hypothetical protein